MPGTLFLCVDTAAAISDSRGCVIARGRAGPANMSEIPLEVAGNEIIKSITSAITSLPSNTEEISGSLKDGTGIWMCPVRFERIIVGISGCDTPRDIINMTAHLQPHFTSPIQLYNDALLLAAPISQAGASWGITTIAGTGSIVLGLSIASPEPKTPISPVDQHDTTHLIPGPPIPATTPSPKPSHTPQVWAKRGGHGHLFHDPGSGYHLGLTAIQMSVDDYDDGSELAGGLAEALRSKFGVRDTCEIPGKAHDLDSTLAPNPSSNARKLLISSISPIVLALSQTCPLAKRVLIKTARSLAEDILHILPRAPGPAGEGVLVITGGLGVQDVYFDEVVRQLGSMEVHFRGVERVLDPAGEGAVALSQGSL